MTSLDLRHQLEAVEEADNYQGLAFMELYRKCRAEFLVASDLALRAQLTEFRDHKLIKSKKGAETGANSRQRGPPFP